MKRHLWILTTILVSVVALVAIVAVLAMKGRESSTAPAPTGLNGMTAVNGLFDGSRDLSGERDRLSEIRSCAHYSFPGGEAGYAKALATSAGAPGTAPAPPILTPPNFLNFQVAAKVFAMESVFHMLEGNRAEALELLADVHHTGELLANSNILVVRMVGVAVCGIAQNRLELYVLNACETPEDCEEAEKTLVALSRALPPVDAAGIAVRVQMPRRSILQWLSRMPEPNLEEMAARHNVVVTRLRLIEMAAAARHRFVATGEFPKTSHEFAPLLPERLVEDPFANLRAPLRFRTDPANGDLICYSVGPDGKDDQGRIATSPGTGGYTPGDIIFRIPREREYPFPRDGVRDESAEEILAQFPDNLPIDPFTNHSSPLGVRGTGPVWVTSVGPDNHPSIAGDPAAQDSPPIPYDPTNGTVSEGDLILQLPGREK